MKMDKIIFIYAQSLLLLVSVAGICALAFTSQSYWPLIAIPVVAPLFLMIIVDIWRGQ